MQTFGKYQILERIATGGMAEIYKARLEGIGGFQRTFAIKRILPNLSQNSEYIAMLVDEAKVAGLLSHANIIQILDLGQVDGIWYIAMEYVAGRDLGAVLRRARKKGLCLPVPHTVFIAIELLKGLEYAHQRQVMRGGRPVALNIIHRDVSPPNVLLSFQGEVKLTDFGIARASLKAMETVSGIVKGRFDYMSPEQAAGSKDLDQRSDLFSVGVVLYEMLTGHHPFRTDNEIGTIEKVRTGRYIPVSQRNPEVPFTLETIVDRALQVNRDDRYPSATAFKEALDKFFHDAGFIFTHATLASYVKGLFPEASARPGKATNVPAAAAPGASSGTPSGAHRVPRGMGAGTPVPVDPSEGPTRRLDRRKFAGDPPTGSITGSAPSPTTGSVPSPTPTTGPTRPSSGAAVPADGDTAPPGSFSGQLGPSGHTGASAQITARTGAFPVGGARSPVTSTGPAPAAGSPTPLDAAGGLGRAPLSDFLGGEDVETLIRKVPPGWEEELATQIRSPAAVGLEAAAFDAKDPETVLRPVKVDEPSLEVSTTGRRLGRRRRPGSPVLTWALSAVSLFFGFLIGGVCVLLAMLVGFKLGPQQVAGVAGSTDPHIEVVAPPGTQILVDGDAVGRSVGVAPGKPHELTITLQGMPPWKTTLTMSAGETRVFVIEAPTVPAAKTGKEKAR